MRSKLQKRTKLEHQTKRVTESVLRIAGFAKDTVKIMVSVGKDAYGNIK